METDKKILKKAKVIMKKLDDLHKEYAIISAQDQDTEIPKDFMKDNIFFKV